MKKGSWETREAGLVTVTGGLLYTMSRARDPHNVQDCPSHQGSCGPKCQWGTPMQTPGHDLKVRRKQRRNTRDLPSSLSKALVSPAGGGGRGHLWGGEEWGEAPPRCPSAHDPVSHAAEATSCTGIVSRFSHELWSGEPSLSLSLFFFSF